MLRARSPLLNFRVSPPNPASPSRRSHQGRFYGRGSVVLDIFYQTAHFFWLDMCHNLYFGKTLLRNAKLVRVCQNYRKFKHKRCSKVMQVFQPRHVQSEMLCVSSPHPETCCGPLGGGGKGRMTFQTTTQRFFLRIQVRNS